MSADRDRGTRRQKQKRAKDKKKLAKQQPSAAVTAVPVATKPVKPARRAAA